MEISFVCILFSHSSREELGWSVEAKQHNQYITSRSYLVHNFQTITICSFKLSRPSRFLLFTFENRKYVKKERPTLCICHKTTIWVGWLVVGKERNDTKHSQYIASGQEVGYRIIVYTILHSYIPHRLLCSFCLYFLQFKVRHNDGVVCFEWNTKREGGQAGGIEFSEWVANGKDLFFP